MDQFFLHNGKCLPDCPSGFYADSRSCSPCHEDCKECDGPDSDDCNECASRSFVLHNGEYYANNSIGLCERCHKSCKECLGPQPTDCLSCDTYFFLLHSKNECLPSCPEYYYEDRDTNTCERCHPTCSSCEGKILHYVLLCHKRKQMWFDCVLYPQRDQSECEKCHDTCIECKGPGPLNCTVCPANMKLYLDEGRCVQCCDGSNLTETQECCDCSETQGRTEMKRNVDI
uniref:Growth factor receptor domain-containing protein n=1 Tax=Chrysemys picta bellii TaxID=8478 RepID=A0A8C3PAF5_CHRPI